MNSHLDVKLQDRMQSYLTRFFHSLQGDTNAIESFASSLSAFQNTIWAHHDKLQVETLLAIRGFASVIDSVTSSVLELETESERLVNETTGDILQILGNKMGKLTISNEQSPELSTEEKAKPHFPSHIKPSYNWLLSNLHNPYPSKEVKKGIARQSNCSVRDIDSWFIDARKRIGWNSLRRQKFSNKQENIIAAASRFFKPFVSSFLDDLSATLDSEGDFNDAYYAEFTAMEDAARTLYSGKLVDMIPPTASSGRSGRQEPSSSTFSKDDQRRKRAPVSQPVNAIRESSTEVPSRTFNQDTVFSYPTPRPSPVQSVESSPPVSIHPPLPSELVIYSHKRRRSSSSVKSPEESESGVQNSAIRPRKRSKPDGREFIRTTDTTVSYSLPSPSPSIHPSEDTPEGDIPTTVSDECPSFALLASSSTKRKRRLSDGDSKRPAKRPHHALAVPRLQAVSDPFPIPRPLTDDSIDEWFYNHFSAERQFTAAIPLPASHDVHDLPVAVPLDVHCDISPYHLDVTLPQTPHDNMSLEGQRSEAILGEVSKLSTPESLLISNSNSLPDLNHINAAEIANADELSLPLDFEFPFTVEQSTSRDIPINVLDQVNFNTLLQVPSPAFNFSWMQYPLDGSVNVVEPSTSFMTENPSISDLDSIIPKGPIIPLDQDVKHLRIQFLREELKLLESEIDP